MTCKRCNSTRILDVIGKVADRCFTSIGNNVINGYVPQDIPPIGGGDYLKFKVCLNCGQMEGTWPLEKIELEEKVYEEEEF